MDGCKNRTRGEKRVATAVAAAVAAGCTQQIWRQTTGNDEQTARRR